MPEEKDEKMKQNKTIDFVLPWVDGNDPEWRTRKSEITGMASSDDRNIRYRDLGLLRYWFRGVEQFAPWVRKIWFICDQEPPRWLNRDHPKLKIVHHEDYLPEEYRPAFSSHPIELNLHRITELSEQFVYFNDDMFLLAPVREEQFFRQGLPRDAALLNPLPTTDLKEGGENANIFTIPLNNAEYLNRDYDFRACVKKYPLKWLNIRYGSGMFRNLVLMIWPRFVGFKESHIPHAYLKSSFEEAWEQDRDILDCTSRHPLRDDRDVNQWLIRYRQMAEGRFFPIKPLGQVFDLRPEPTEEVKVIREQGMPMICLNDGELDEVSFMRVKQQIREAFQSILPGVSSFETGGGTDA